MLFPSLTCSVLVETIIRSGMYKHQPVSFAVLLLLTVASTASFAQHGSHTMSAEGSALLESMPDNDEVLGVAPKSIMLHFDSAVRLVKLVVKDPSKGKDGLDIGFRYQGKTGIHYEHPLPDLKDANYYRVEWAAFDSNETLLKGAFHFSFGENALPPSHYLKQMEHPNQIISPDYRLLQ